MVTAKKPCGSHTQLARFEVYGTGITENDVFVVGTVHINNNRCCNKQVKPFHHRD